MRKFIAAAVFALALATGGAAFAQSQQGGYLGQNPAGHQIASAAPGQLGSRQGGYLGQNAGANLQPARVADADTKSSPTAWCSKSVEPSRCRGGAVDNHKICMGNVDHYDSCRAALDRMYFK